MENNPKNVKKFGTFLGVYAPSVLTILGLIMYLRFGWVLSNVGLAYTILIVVIASSITLITGLSASAIATNMLVGAGGEYYMVSRSLGIEMGGAIGIPLYFCRTLSVTFYCFGLAEATIMFWPVDWGAPPANITQWVAGGIIVLITLLSGKSAELVLKAQIPILILVVGSIVALVLGVFSGPIQSPSFEAHYTTAQKGFWYVFAVFFPAVTGFTAGIGMSGDLKDPKKSIPLGTIGAVLTCLGIYILIPIILGISTKVPDDVLANPERGVEAWGMVALFGSLFIVPAVLGAILSSAFGSILNGPRVLQALSDDGLAPKLFARLSPSGQPTIATWGTGAIALIAVLLGGLNTVAVLVSVLFLTLYVAINLSAAIEVIVAEPHYRPKIKVPWYISLLGALGAIFVMFLISPWACLIAIIIEIGIFTYLSRKALEQKWGDVGSGLLLNIAKKALLSQSKRPRNDRNWRPIILLFTAEIKNRAELVKLGASIAESKGVLTLSQMVPLSSYESHEKNDAALLEMYSDLQELGIEAFCEVNIVKHLDTGSLEIARAHGIAGLKSNTIMEGVSERISYRPEQISKLRSMADYGKNIIYAKINRHLPKDDRSNNILIWWGGAQNNGDLMLLLAYLMQLSQDYRKEKILIKSIVRNDKDKEMMETQIEQQLASARIKAEVEILISDSDINRIIRKESRYSKVVMLGLPFSGNRNDESLADWVNEMSKENQITLFVYNAGMADAVPRLLK
ncbi:MAG: amino acid permease [Saprospiraceae bacterium]|nr:amino acid permease [Saprospiraceae bacterium]